MDSRCLIKRRMLLFAMNVLLVSGMIFSFLGRNVMPFFLQYGLYQCKNVMNILVTSTIEEEMVDVAKNKIITNINDEKGIEYNTYILNSLLSTVIKKICLYLYQFSDGELKADFYNQIGISKIQNSKEILYKIPVGSVLDNVFLANAGIYIPVKYKLIGEVTGEIVSTISNYGINNALLEIDFVIKAKSKVIIPFLSSEEIFETSSPIVMHILQGEIPDGFYGSNIIGGVR